MVEAWHRSDQAAQALLRPGTRVSDLYTTLINSVENSGFISPLEAGHDLGLDAHESITVEAVSPVVLQPGMVLAIHACVMEKVAGDGVGMGYTYLITEDGAGTVQPHQPSQGAVMKMRSANLVIIGGGGSGLAAALTAAEHGLDKITVVEKRQALGGTSALAGGIFACESPVQERDKVIADKDNLFRKAMDWAHYDRVDPSLLRAFINQSGDTVRWLEAMGLEFKLIRHYPDQYPPVQHNPVGGGARLTEVLAEKSRAAGVDLRLHCAAEKIVRNEIGRITGVVVQEDEEKVVYDTPLVIIATGGFPGNRELLKKYCLHWFDDMPVSGLPLQGDGLKLAADAGAALETFATMIKEGPRLHPYKWPLMTFERDPRTLWVNREGRRFIDETADTGFSKASTPC